MKLVIKISIFVLLFYQIKCLDLDDSCMRKQEESDECTPKCLDYNPDGPSVFVKDSTGRLGNIMFTYSSLMALKLKYNVEVYLGRKAFTFLSKYFDNLEIENGENVLCGFREVFSNFTKYLRDFKLNKITKILDSKLGRKMEWERAEDGKIIIPQEIASIPGLEVNSIVHSTEFDKVDDYTIPKTTKFPWEVYNASMKGLEDTTSGTNMLKGKSIILLTPYPTDLSRVNETPGLEARLDHAFRFKPKFLDSAKQTLDKIINEHKAKMKKKKKKNKNKNNKNEEFTFVGIHSRRTDHLDYDNVHGDIPLKGTYFLDAMDMYRDFYKNVIFLYISDDLEWGRTTLGTKMKAAKDLYFVGEGASLSDDSVGHDLALMSLCNHTIISHGTFSFWAGFLAGGNVITPYHFYNLRPKTKIVVGYDGHPFKNPLKRLHFQ